MLKKTSKKSLRISANELSQFATEGIQRALETHNALVLNSIRKI
jgi:hypothetical protein